MSSVNVDVVKKSDVETSGVKKSDAKKSDAKTSDSKTSVVTKFIYNNVDRTIYIILVCILLISLISCFKSPTWLLIIISIIFILLYILLDHITAI